MNRVRNIDKFVTPRRGLLSVFDKSGLADFVTRLLRIAPDFVIMSTGGTYKAIESTLDADKQGHLESVESYTGQPEMQGGLVKTLDFRIYMGLLSETYNDNHVADLERSGAAPIDLVVANLYPFRDVISRDGTTLEDARANIDIGGPCMIRAAAKNFLRVAVLTSPDQYGPFLDELETKGAISLDTRYRLAKEAFAHTASYDATISEYLLGNAVDPSLYTYLDDKEQNL